jgi:nicotinamide-nucleotide amidase
MRYGKMEGIAGGLLRARDLTLAAAESCTGGLLGHRVTQVPGSSDYFLGGVIAYSNSAKVKLLGVRARTIRLHGAVSQEAAVEMAAGACRAFGADIGLSVTGIAGPSGGSRSKPVGLVYVALAIRGKTIVRRYIFHGTRHEIKSRATRAAMSILCDYLRKAH